MIELINKIFGDPNERKVRKLEPDVDIIAHLEPEMEKLSDEDLRRKTAHFKQLLDNREFSEDPRRDRQLEEEMLDNLLPEAFAVVREAGRRALNMRHFDMQLVGGMVLHKGGISEMRTGEGKTLVATLPAYLNALTGRGVHIITVNDYLAKRDSEWMGEIYKFLGLSVGVVLSSRGGFQNSDEKRDAYRADITYGTNNEFGFDYLRDNMAGAKNNLVQRPYFYAIIDEVDSILIDEARTPLIISGRLEHSAETYRTMARVAPLLKRDEDYTVEEKARSVVMTEEGIDRAQELLNVPDLYDPRTNMAHYVLQALRAKELFKRDTDYVVKDDQVVIVDEFTGRMMEGRRWSDGLHQSIEARENVRIQDETQTLASITFQNLFRLYPKLAGMTGTAMTEEAEFGKIYNLEVTTIPTNRKDVRTNNPDVIYKTEKVKFYKAVEEITECFEKGRPTLVGTTSIEKSEWLSAILSQPIEMTQFIKTRATRLLTTLEEQKLEEQANRLRKYLKSPEAYSEEDFERLAEEEKSDKDLADALKSLGKTAKAVQIIRKGVPHHVLNAKHHEKEASIVAQAGRYKAVTIATNMAGRGTDILLGGNPEFLAREHFALRGQDWRDAVPEEYKAILHEMQIITEKEKQQVVELGGLHIIGTERHESRRIDNQLRGRAARQGDPGSTRFYLSLEDTLMRIFGGQTVSGLMDMLKVDETLPITAKMVSGAIEGAQRKVEAYNFDLRKNILQYDDVLTEQRKLIYAQRRKVLEGYGLRDSILHMLNEEMARCVTSYLTPEASPEDWDAETVDEMLASLHNKVPQLSNIEPETIKGKNYQQLLEFFQEQGQQAYGAIEEELARLTEELKIKHGVTLMGIDADEDEAVLEKLDEKARGELAHPLRRIERDILLSIVDAKWIDYLHSLDALREGIGLRAYGQKDPLIEYKREAFEMFQHMTYDIQRETIGMLFRTRIELQLERMEEGEDGEFIDTPLTDAMDSATTSHPALDSFGNPTLQGSQIPRDAKVADASWKTSTATQERPGRNDDCPCGSGKKYKKCHGAG